MAREALIAVLLAVILALLGVGWKLHADRLHAETVAVEADARARDSDELAGVHAKQKQTALDALEACKAKLRALHEAGGEGDEPPGGS